jgi:hypothetical protein
MLRRANGLDRVGVARESPEERVAPAPEFHWVSGLPQRDERLPSKPVGPAL